FVKNAIVFLEEFCYNHCCKQGFHKKKSKNPANTGRGAFTFFVLSRITINPVADDVCDDTGRYCNQ
ncbi:MAG: hypothetical protein LUF30_01205, partial [Lachnospiraceae bacterium]|nr:hypothetical protein [Lachnospiraceae bacterium]